MKRLILFDIDETIVYSDGVGRRAMERALSSVFQRRIDAGSHNMSGKTDPQICFEILEAIGYDRSEIERLLPEAFTIYLQQLEREIRDSKNFGLHKGVRDLLALLAQNEQAHLGLLTGNIEGGARLKLAPFELNSFFAFGAFGSDSADRLQLPSLAHERANAALSMDFDKNEIVIIGDAVNDVLCAKAYGVKCIITATGKTPKESLLELSPEFIFDSLANTTALLEAINS